MLTLSGHDARLSASSGAETVCGYIRSYTQRDVKHLQCAVRSVPSLKFEEVTRTEEATRVSSCGINLNLRLGF